MLHIKSIASLDSLQKSEGDAREFKLLLNLGPVYVRYAFWFSERTTYTYLFPVSLCLRCGMQFLGNMVTQNEENQTAIWRAMKKLFT